MRNRWERSLSLRNKRLCLVREGFASRARFNFTAGSVYRLDAVFTLEATWVARVGLSVLSVPRCLRGGVNNHAHFPPTRDAARHTCL
jgi:hypothetical protein